MRYFMGVDLGTSSVKAVLMGEDGRITGLSQREYGMDKPRATYAEQDMEVLWRAVREALCELTGRCREHLGNLCGVGFSGQMHGLVMTDREGSPVRKAIIWADQRSEEAVASLYRQIPEEQYRQITLNALGTGFLIASLLWVRKEEPRNFERAYRVMLPKDYIRFKMCGEWGTDMTDASGTGVFDTAHRNWAWEIIDRLSISRELFVPCFESGELVGKCTRQSFAETGVPEGTPIVCGGGDTLMQAVGNGIMEPGILVSNVGTASQVACAVDAPLCDPLYRINTFCHVREGVWMMVGANLSGGVSLQWLKQNILHMDTFDEMAALASQSPAGSGGLLFLPYLNGERTPWNDPEARGIYFGLNLNHTRADMIRSTMEGIVFNQKCSLEILQDRGLSFSRIISSGGGARSRLFREILADVFGKEICRSLVKEQAAVGAAVTAAVGVGVYRDFSEACRCITRLDRDVVEPDPVRVRRYEEQFQQFKALYPANRRLFCRKTPQGKTD
ncbi:MAG: xylulokinase [Lachnospiraceae bacterium]|nr:xylulokinase [Lachnospiraceae bacterium]